MLECSKGIAEADYYYRGRLPDKTELRERERDEEVDVREVTVQSWGFYLWK